jgi:PAS domain S-box-containing protein
MLGYGDVSDVVGKKIHKLLHHTRADGTPYPEDACTIMHTIANGQSAHSDDEVFWRSDGSSIPVSYRSYPIYKDEKLVGAVVTFLDISEKIHTQEALRTTHEHLHLSLRGTISAVARAVEARDPYTAGHQQRVAALSVAIGRRMGHGDDMIEGIHMGATIHDIGKIYLPAEILSKPGRLSDMEFQLVQNHPQVGYEILKDIIFPWPVAEIAYQHHERLDGSGYPLGLAGDAICHEARIVAVADVVEAMASHRPYRPSMGIDAALEEIKSKQGVKFDAPVVDACVKLFTEDKYNFEDAAG